jgi:hypothetical protein
MVVAPPIEHRWESDHGDLISTRNTEQIYRDVQRMLEVQAYIDKSKHTITT